MLPRLAAAVSTADRMDQDEEEWSDPEDEVVQELDVYLCKGTQATENSKVGAQRAQRGCCRLLGRLPVHMA